MQLRIFCGVLLLVTQSLGQGTLWFYTSSALTRIGSADGPFAGPGIWGQLLAGPTTTNLSPIGGPVEHNVAGFISAGFVSSPNVACYTLGYAQLVAWDGRLWGTDLNNVPFDQRGATDVVGVFMNCDNPFRAPQFTQPAVVPIPEPNALMLFALGGTLAVAGLTKRISRRLSTPPARL